MHTILEDLTEDITTPTLSQYLAAYLFILFPFIANFSPNIQEFNNPDLKILEIL